MEKTNKKKGFLGNWLDKLDKKLKEKAEKASSCCGSNSKKNGSSCCGNNNSKKDGSSCC